MTNEDFQKDDHTTWVEDCSVLSIATPDQSNLKVINRYDASGRIIHHTERTQLIFEKLENGSVIKRIINLD